MKILIVEDNAPLRMSMYSLLKKEGYEVFTHPTSSGVDSFVLTFKPDLILTDNDLGLREEKGLSLASRMKEQGVDVILMSGDDLSAAAESRGIPFFPKGSPVTLLFDLIKSMEVSHAGAA